MMNGGNNNYNGGTGNSGPCPIDCEFVQRQPTCQKSCYPEQGGYCCCPDNGREGGLQWLYGVISHMNGNGNGK